MYTEQCLNVILYLNLYYNNIHKTIFNWGVFETIYYMLLTILQNNDLIMEKK